MKLEAFDHSGTSLQLVKANEQTKGVLEELATAQTYIGRLHKSSEIRISVDAGIISSKSHKTISTLTNRLHVLEAQNAKLKSAAKREITIGTMQLRTSGFPVASTATVPGSSQTNAPDLNVTGLIAVSLSWTHDVMCNPQKQMQK